MPYYSPTAHDNVTLLVFPVCTSSFINKVTRDKGMGGRGYKSVKASSVTRSDKGKTHSVTRPNLRKISSETKEMEVWGGGGKGTVCHRSTRHGTVLIYLRVRGVRGHEVETLGVWCSFINYDTSERRR